MRLIDADALKLTFCRECTLRDDGCPEKTGGECDVQAVYHIEHCAKTVDAVPVVRCRECKYYMKSNEQCELVDMRLKFYSTHKRWTEESFCSWGRRKDGAE
jgi:hypothetical protein